MSFDHIPPAEKNTPWFLLLTPVIQARLSRNKPEESPLIRLLNSKNGLRTWKTLKTSIERTLQGIDNGGKIFSRKEEILTAENPDNPIEEMFAEFRAIGYLRQKGFVELKYFRQKGSDFTALFDGQIYHIEITYIHGPNLKTFHHNPDLVHVILDAQDPDYLKKREELLQNWDYSQKLRDLLKSRYSKKENQLIKRKVPEENCLILIITDLIETHEPWFDHVKFQGNHPILHFVKTQKIATVVHGNGSVYEPDPTALGGIFGKLELFTWEKYPKF
jgi:hypothetical protein